MVHHKYGYMILPLIIRFTKDLDIGPNYSLTVNETKEIILKNGNERVEYNRFNNPGVLSQTKDT